MQQLNWNIIFIIYKYCVLYYVYYAVFYMCVIS